MNKKWKDYDYKAVNLPSGLLSEVDKAVKKQPLYTSRSDFVKKAIIKQLEYEGMIGDPSSKQITKDNNNQKELGLDQKRWESILNKMDRIESILESISIPNHPSWLVHEKNKALWHSTNKSGFSSEDGDFTAPAVVSTVVVAVINELIEKGYVIHPSGKELPIDFPHKKK